jgi:exopolysaccharide biosynthesis protein
MDTFRIIVFSFFPLLFFTLTIYYFIKNKRNKNLLKAGQKTNATITHIYYYITNDQQFDITYQFYDTQNRLYEKKLITVNKAETTSEKLEKNQSLVVYYNPKNPNQHIVPLLCSVEDL